jgi:hypothetical protein
MHAFIWAKNCIFFMKITLELVGLEKDFLQLPKNFKKCHKIKCFVRMSKLAAILENGGQIMKNLIHIFNYGKKLGNVPHVKFSIIVTISDIPMVDHLR